MLDYSADGGVAQITIADVRLLSKHDIVAAKDLRDAIWEANDDNDVKVIVLRSDAHDFSPRVTAKPDDNALRNFTAFQDAYYGPHGLYQSVCYPKKVVVLEVQGECAGAGTLLMLYSDIVVASSDSTFRTPADDLPASNTIFPILIMGLHRAKAWNLAGRPLSAQDAEAWGVVNYVVEREGLRAKTAECAAKIARMPLDAITSTKMGFNAVADSSGASEDFALSAFYAASRHSLS